jgi:hypothetical protein
MQLMVWAIKIRQKAEHVAGLFFGHIQREQQDGNVLRHLQSSTLFTA